MARETEQVNAADAPIDEAVPAEDVAGSVDVVLIGVGWARHDFKTGRSKRHKRGDRLTVTEAEWKLLGEGVKPTLRKATEDD